MARWKKPTPAETRIARQLLADRARRGELRLPEATVDIRKAFGLNQEEFGKLVGLSRRQVAEIEAGTANSTRDTMERIGRLFGFTLGLVPRAQPDEADDDQNTPSSGP